MEDDVFLNVIDTQKFRSTNQIWNQLKLNHPFSVGYVTTLIESKPFTCKEEWRDYYFASGEERLEMARRENIDLSDRSSPRAKHLQLNFGRTLNEIRQKGKFLFDAIEMQGNPLNISLSECIYMTKFRVIGETWNGVIVRERNTIQTLQQHYPQLKFLKVSGDIDFKYAIDYEVFLNNHLLCAIQIKPLSYKNGKSPEIQTARNANLIKNNTYKNEFGKPVLYVYSNNKGEVLDEDFLIELNELIKKELMIA